MKKFNLPLKFFGLLGFALTLSVVFYNPAQADVYVGNHSRTSDGRIAVTVVNTGEFAVKVQVQLTVLNNNGDRQIVISPLFPVGPGDSTINYVKPPDPFSLIIGPVKIIVDDGDPIDT